MGDEFCPENFFDSFDFDDGFLSKMDAEVKKMKKRARNHSNVYQKSLEGGKKEGNVKKILNVDLDDLNDSDFEKFSLKSKKKSPLKISTDSIRDREALIGCLSPIQGPLLSNHNRSFTSTPLRKENPILNQKDEEKEKKKNFQKSEFDYLEADLFEEWDVSVEKKAEEENLITLSQAVQLIEEAKSSTHEEQPLNESIDLLTGEIINVKEMKNLFADSFNLPNADSDDLKRPKNGVVPESPEVDQSSPESKDKSKPAAAQKLNFWNEKVDLSDCEQNNAKKNLNDLQNFWLSSDEEFEVLTQKHSEPKKVPDTLSSLNKNCSKSLKDDSVIDLSDDSIELKKRRRKCYRILESGTEEESPSPKFRRIKKNKKISGTSNGIEFVDLEAEVSDESNVSSDEELEDGDEYDKSFVDEASYFTQNQSVDMTSKYLESVKEVEARPGAFKIPKAKPYNPDDIFSQMPQESNTDYEIDSFCVREVEEETRTDLSDLEIAERILEMNRKKKRRKRNIQSLDRFK